MSSDFWHCKSPPSPVAHTCFYRRGRRGRRGQTVGRHAGRRAGSDARFPLAVDSQACSGLGPR